MKDSFLDNIDEKDGGIISIKKLKKANSQEDGSRFLMLVEDRYFKRLTIDLRNTLLILYCQTVCKDVIIAKPIENLGKFDIYEQDNG